GLGGRAAEELACDQITAGAQSDLQGVTRVARAMVTQLGMDDELGPEIFGGSGESGLDGSPYAAWEPKEYSEDTARRIDAAVHRLISEAHQKACGLLGANRPALDAISDALLHEESLNLDQIVALVRAIPAGAAS
ncbi:MAG TPA: cell division protein FtsH, partial [Chloroflexota bacterium]|nr:cell division protein FtsH [Chloroflexota bacterium]